VPLGRQGGAKNKVNNLITTGRAIFDIINSVAIKFP
jgi:hypothetical protein